MFFCEGMKGGGGRGRGGGGGGHQGHTGESKGKRKNGEIMSETVVKERNVST